MFKAVDIVRCIENYGDPFLNEGELYQVDFSTGYIVRFVNMGGVYPCNRFVLATGKNDVPQRPGYTKVEYPGTAPLQPLADELAASWYPTEGSAYTADGIVWSTDNGLERIEKPTSVHKCRCEIQELMKQGCTCKGV